MSTRGCLFWVYAASCSLWLVPPMARAIPLTFYSNADSYIRGGYPNTNDGALDTLRVRPSGPTRTLLRFDQIAINSQVAGGEVQSATLLLYVESAMQFSPAKVINLHRLSKDWSELEVTWNSSKAPTPWASPGGDFTPVPVATYVQTNSLTPVAIDVTDEIEAFLGGANNYGWLLRKELETSDGSVVYTSRNETDPLQSENRPRLVIEVSFPPGTPTPTFTVPTATPTRTPTSTPPVGTMRPECSNPEGDDPKACDKISTFPLRSLRDWAACLERVGTSPLDRHEFWGRVDGDSPPDLASPGCGVYIDDGGENVNLTCNMQSPGSLEDEELQASETTTNCELERDLHHCEYKLLYQGECKLTDWAVVEHLLAGSLPSSPSNVFKYAGGEGEEDDKAWYPCIPWQHDTIYKTIRDVWLPFLAKRVTCVGGPRDGLSCMAGEGCGPPENEGDCVSELTPPCAREALAAMGESLDEFIHKAGDDDVTEDKKAFWRCEEAFGNNAVQNACKTCPRTGWTVEDGYPNIACDEDEEVTTQEWDDLCKFLKAQYNPFRQACRGFPGNRTSASFWEIAPTPTAIP